MGIEVAVVVGAACAEAAYRKKFAGNPGHAHEDPILAQRRATEREAASRDTRIAADLATVQRDNRVGLGLLVALLIAFVALIASCVGPDVAYAQRSIDKPAIEPAEREHTRLQPNDDGHVRRGGTD